MPLPLRVAVAVAVGVNVAVAVGVNVAVAVGVDVGVKVAVAVAVGVNVAVAVAVGVNVGVAVAVAVGVEVAVAVAVAVGVGVGDGHAGLVIVWHTVAEVLLHASTARQHRVYIVLVPCVVVSSLTCCTVDVPQASEAVGGVNTGVPSHAIVVSAPAEPIVGAVVSSTVMVWLDVLLLPQ